MTTNDLTQRADLTRHGLGTGAQEAVDRRWQTCEHLASQVPAQFGQAG